MHACNMYTSLDQIDFSALSDVMPSDPLIDVETLLIGKSDIDELNGAVEVLLEIHTYVMYTELVLRATNTHLLCTYVFILHK